MAAQLGVEVEPLAACDRELGADEVDAGDELRHGMLDLDARVQLEEEERAAVEDELRRAGALVADRAGERDRRLAHRRAQLRADRRRGGLLEHLLVAALHRAVPLTEREDGPVPVGEELDLDVARPLEVALEEHRVVAEGRLRLALRRLDRVVQLRRAAHDAHAAAAAARSRFYDQWEADLLR